MPLKRTLQNKDVKFASIKKKRKKIKTKHTLTLIKFIPLSRAITPASKVFPVPGGPYNSTPVLCRMGKLANSSGY